MDNKIYGNILKRTQRRICSACRIAFTEALQVIVGDAPFDLMEKGRCKRCERNRGMCRSDIKER